MKNSPRKKRTTEILIDERYCKGCYLCIQVCPQKVLARGEIRSRAGYPMPQVADIEKCSTCLLCEMTCPDLSLTVVRVE
jgi:2-oxoglutarate ferredoxin oxidoreductase subunit delta